MRKVLHKVKSQWIVLGVLGATVVSLGTADVRQVSASEIEGASASKTLAARELGTADVSVEAAEKAAHIGLDHAISTATTDGTATVFVHWNEDETITVTVKDLNGSVLYSDLLVDSEGENTIKVLTANQDYYTIKIAVKAAATEQTTTATEPIELAVPGVLAEVEAPEEVAAEENDYAKIVSTTEVDYPALIARATDAINTAPWGVEGYQTLASSADYAGKTVDVTKEQVTDYGVTWALVSLNGKELGWIAKDALTVQTYAAITSETIVDYPATISRGTDAINLAPWGTRGYQTISSSATYVGKTVNVIKEQTTDYGVTWAQISLNGEVLGWIAKDALTAQTYAAVVSETEVDYPATVNRDSDAINTAPWGVKGYQTLSSSADYVGQTVEVKKEQVTDYGVTWAQISLNGEVLGWIAKDALKIQTYAQITKETDVDYSATISRDSDAINTAPWGVKGYQTLSSSAAYVGQTVEVTKEQVTDYGVTWALVSQNGKALGWIAKDALKVQTYAQITKETAVSYDAIVNRDSDAINTAPWGVKGYQTLSSSAAFVGQTVEVTKEQVTDYGVTWALVSQNGKELGWIAKDALKVQTYAQITKETAVNYDAIVSRDSDAINTAPWGVKGYQTLSSSAAYAGQTVEVTKEQTTDYGVTWALVSHNGKELGWIAKDALKVQTYAQIVSENEVAYPALINRGTDAINTSPWGTKGYQTNASSADYLGQTVEVTKEQTTDYGVTWALVSLNGKELGWIAKDALIVMERTMETVVAKENTVAYQTVTEEDNTIPIGERVVVQAGVEGYDTVTYDVTYVNGVETNRVEVSRTTTAPVNEIVKVGTQVTEVKSETKVEKEIAYATVEESDNTIPTGERVVVKAGEKGYDTVNYDVTYLNGIETNRVEISRTTTAPVAEVIKVGTQVTEVKSETTTEIEVAFATVEEEDNTIPFGERVVVQAGVKGYDTVTFDVTYVNGIETNRVEVSRTTTASVAEIVKVGTQVTEVKSETTTENEVAFATVEEEDNTIPIGERVVVQAGVKGYDTVTFDVTYVNGVETNRVEVSRITTAPVAEVVKAGTQVTEVKSETTTENEVAYSTIEEFDNTIPTGERIVVQTGVKGYETVSYDVTYVNGVETNRVEVSRTTTASVAEIVKVGTQVTEVKTETNTEIEVAFATVEEEDNTIPVGERVVVQAGMKGYDTVTFDVTYVNGVETNRVEVNRTTTAPVNEIIKVGTQVTEVKSERTTETEVGFPTVEEEDNTIPTGERVVAQTGVNGYDTVTFDVTYVNGIETNRVEVSRVTTAPVSKIVKVGTQVTEVKSETTTETEVDFAIIEEFDNTIPTGERIVVQTGVKGYDTVSYDVTFVNGIETKRVEVSRTTTASVSEIVKVGTQVTEIKSEIAIENEVGFTTVEEEDNAIPAGERVVVQAGANGYDTVSYDVTYVNGVETNRVEVSRETVVPMNEIVKVGTKIMVDDIIVTSTDDDSIILNGSTLQMAVSISPDNATASEVTWSVEAGTGTATIDSTGLLTAMSAGTVTVKAAANDGSGVVGNKVIEIALPVSISGFNGSALRVDIPEVIDGNQLINGYYNGLKISGNLGLNEKGIVTSIGKSVFVYKGLTNVTIPDSVTSIGDSAFYGNPLTNVIIPDSVTSIGYAAFMNNSFATIDIPDSVTFIGELAFCQNQLTSIDIPNGVTNIGAGAFSGNKLTSVVIPDGVTIIGDRAFSSNQITTLSLSDSVVSIGFGAFSYNRLTSLTIPVGVTSIGGEAFLANNLMTVDIPDGVTTIGYDAFRNNQLMSVDIPVGVTIIESGTFMDNQLMSVSLPDGLLVIGSSAFGNNKLTSIEIPETVTNIAPYAFANNEITSINIPDSITSIGIGAFWKNLLTNVDIPQNITRIETAAFGNNRLTSIVIPDSITIIGDSSFQNNQLVNVIIPDSVTTIGNNAFENNILSSVKISKGIATIGTQAFNNNQLISVIIPDGVTSIGNNAFSNNQLSSAVIPNTVSTIGTSAFYNNELTEIVIPDNVTIIGSYAFQGNLLTSIIIPENVAVIGTGAISNNQLTSITIGEGVLVGENLLGTTNSFRTVYTIGGSGIYTGTQDGEWLKVITEKKSETTIESIVGYSTIEQEDSTFPTGQTEVIQAGAEGYDKVMYEVTYTNGVETARIETGRTTTVPVDEVVRVGTQVIEMNTEISKENVVAYEKVKQEDNSLPVGQTEVIQAGVDGYDMVTYEVTYINGVEKGRAETARTTTAPVAGIVKVGTQGAVKSITVTAAGDTSIVLNGKILQMSATVMPEDAKEASVIWSVENGTGTATIDEYGLLTATGSGTVTVKAAAKDGLGAFGIKEITVAVPVNINGYSGTDTSIEIPELIIGNQKNEAGFYDGFNIIENLDSNDIGIVTGISAYSFNNKQLTSIVMPESLTSIGDFAFSINQLSGLVIPENVTSIGENAFSYNQLSSIVIPKSLANIGINAFSNNKLSSIVIPDNIISIDSGAFSGNQLTNIVIPESVTSIGRDAFSNNQLTSIVIPKSITNIGESAFYNNRLTSIMIPESVTSIGSDAFRINRLSSLVIPTSVTSIGSGAFSSNQLTSIVIPQSVTSIGSGAFSSNRLTSVVIPDSVKSIEDYAFGSNQLISIAIPDSVISIGREAFSNNQLISVVIPASVTSIGSGAFNTNQLSNIVIPESVTSIGYSAFRNNKLSSIVIPKNVTRIEYNTFSGNRLTSVVIPEGVVSIGSSAFSGNQLTNVVIPASVTSIGTYAFSNNLLNGIVIPASVTSIGSYAFSSNQLTNVVISTSVTSIGDYAFYNNRLTNLIIPKSVTKIGYCAFKNNQLSSLVIPESVIRIDSDAFGGNQLTSIVIPESVTSIGSYAFSYNQLSNVVIPESVTFIGYGAFSTNKLTRITIGEGVTIEENLLGSPGGNNFRTAYTTGGAGTYTGTQDGEWIKISE